MNRLHLKKGILEAVESSTPEALLADFTFTKEVNNELFFFFKPECFCNVEPHQLGALLDMALSKFDKFEAEVCGALLLDGGKLEQYVIMDRHYGFINRISKNAGTETPAEDLEKIRRALEIPPGHRVPVLGGHEFLKEYPRFDATSLNELWRTKNSFKLRSGLYFQQYDIEGQQVVMVNGFHPAQLHRFTKPVNRIVVLLLRSDLGWETLKQGLGGDTYPEKALPGSIRGELFKNKETYGLKTVNVSRNCIHLSAGPFEAFFEIENFLKNVDAVNFEMEKTNMARIMKKQGFDRQSMQHCLDNPGIQVNGKDTDLFTLTEEMDTIRAVEEYGRLFGKSR